MRILYIDIDSQRADHLGCYGYHRNTTPNIDALAGDGVRFENAYCSDAPCLPSRTAFYSGMFGIRSGVVGHMGTAADYRTDGKHRGFRDRLGGESLPARLMKEGIYTAQISPFGQRHSARTFFEGFNEIHNTGKGGNESAEEVQPVVMNWLERKGREDNWYLHLNYWDPHTPYRVPGERGTLFEDEPMAPWLTEEVFARHLTKTGPHSALDVSMYDGSPHPRFDRHQGELGTYAQLKRHMDNYDTAVRYVDDMIGEIVQWLKANGIYEETAIIVSADHGENQGELGIYAEHGTADQITCRLPLVVKWPGGARATVDREFRYHLDLAPTLAELLGFEPSPSWDGQSYAGALRGHACPGHEHLVLGQCAHVCQRSVRFGPWLYIRTYFDGFHLFPREMLFDIEQDPHEQHDLAGERRDVCDEALRRLHDWQADAMERSDSDVDPLWTVMHEGGPAHARLISPGQPGGLEGLGKYIERLEATGRADGAKILRQRYGL